MVSNTITSDEKIKEDLYKIILSILPSLKIEDIDDSLHLKELGADSVDRVEIIMGVLDHFSLREPMSSFSEIPNIRALIELLKHLAGRSE